MPPSPTREDGSCTYPSPPTSPLIRDPPKVRKKVVVVIQTATAPETASVADLNEEMPPTDVAEDDKQQQPPGDASPLFEYNSDSTSSSGDEETQKKVCVCSFREKPCFLS